MFKNAGKKLRTLVQISFFIFAGADIILPMVMYNSRAIDEMTCFIVIIIALIGTYLFHLFFYALAELIENVNDIKEATTYTNDALLFISKNLYATNKTNNTETEENKIDVNINEDNQ